MLSVHSPTDDKHLEEYPEKCETSKDRWACEKTDTSENSSEGASGESLGVRLISVSRMGNDPGRAGLIRRSSALEEVVVTSVALDSSSVFECSTCCGDLCETPSQRKAVKEKAVKAMAEDGVDISAFVPKTMEEIIPHLTDQAANPKENANRENSIDGSIASAKSGTPSPATIDEISAAYSSTLFLSSEGGGDLQKLDPSYLTDSNKKPVDKLIVLCSCGDDVKRRLVRRSKSVEEWNVDAPTAAAKKEGEGAYRRVSLEIKKEVDILLGSLLGDGHGYDANAIQRGPIEEEKKLF